MTLCALATSMAALTACHGSETGANQQSVASNSAVAPTQETVYEEGSLIGKRFPDIRVVTSFGMETSLRRITDTPYTLVVLYRPGTEGYRNTLNQLSLDRGIENAIIDHDLTIVAVDMESDLEELRLLATSFPSIWRRTALCESISVPTPLNPTMYLIDSSRRVVLQRPDIESVLKVVDKHKQQ